MKTKTPGKVYIGTSGWHYLHWRGPFYPRSIEPQEFLTFYARRFSTVEINNSFYHLPPRTIFRRWQAEAGNGFHFSIKANRYITHFKKLNNARNSLRRLLHAACGLKDALGPVLFQLPPRWKCNLPRFKQFLSILPRTTRYAFEFRDKTWFNPDVYRLLTRYMAAFCITEIGSLKSPKLVTTDFIYIRLHGPNQAYQGTYSRNQLRRWADYIVSQRNMGKDVWCYFDNDQKGYAVANALVLRDIVSFGANRHKGLHKRIAS